MIRGTLLLQNGLTLALVAVEAKDDHFEGSVLELTSSACEVSTFCEYEEAVLSQLLVEVDVLEERIARLSPRFLTEVGVMHEVEDLQLYPRQRGVSFRIRSSLGLADSK